MNQYEIVLKNGKQFKYTGDVILFNEGDKVNLKGKNTIYLNAKEVSCVKNVQEK